MLQVPSVRQEDGQTADGWFARREDDLASPLRSSGTGFVRTVQGQGPGKGTSRSSSVGWWRSFVLATKAASLLACPGYSTSMFVETFLFFVGIYGKPRLVYTDHAPSLIKAAESHDWDEIATAVGGMGTVWKLTAKGCSWRNGLSRKANPLGAPHIGTRAPTWSHAGLPPVWICPVHGGLHT